MRTALYDEHLALKGKIVDFHGWSLPLNYGSQIEEHHAVRRKVGMFDVSHMTVIDLHGEKVVAYLRKILSNDVSTLTSSQALYSGMLNEHGGVIDDLIAYKFNDHYFRLVVNSATREKDLNWLKKWAVEFSVSVEEIHDKCIIAVQGPEAIAIIQSIFPEATTGLSELKPFHFIQMNDYFIARTGYTGEKGVEIIASTVESIVLWRKLLDAGVQPCGLGARDTLRLEAGLNLYGRDMDDNTSPLISNLTWTVVFSDDRDFIGKKSLENEKKEGITFELVGLILNDKGVLRSGQKVILADGREGIITSGGFSPTLEKGIALARLPLPLTTAHVDIRGSLKSLAIVTPNFVRHGTPVYKPLVV